MKNSRISVVHLFTAWIYCTGAECKLWSNKPDYNGFTSPTFIAEYDVQSLLGCGIYCQQSTSCLAYIYFQQTCQLLSGFLNSVSGLQTSENARYFETEYVVEEADEFRNVTLSGEGVFSYMIVRQHATFNEAVSACTSIGSHLVRLSTTKHAYLVNVFKSSSDYNQKDIWVDGSNVDATDVTDINEWVFTNGVPMPVELWTGIYPDSNGRYCAQLWNGITWNIDDAGCHAMNWYICEK